MYDRGPCLDTMRNYLSLLSFVGFPFDASGAVDVHSTLHVGNSATPDKLPKTGLPKPELGEIPVNRASSKAGGE
jgi:hypothetical protein